ncbi:MAG: glycosyltransferase family 39 protein [Acidobacteriaceae bacterium]|nr:glycosyltransferase family 39 protein [Acidobacteriaceae bacterium]MBV9781912.1 glycosyltransferase family 39 protein [Acidobacteriaceae bacterium]
MPARLPETISVAVPVAEPVRKSQYCWLVFFFLLETLLIIHLRVLGLPFFWDEAGQFIPTALDLLRSGSWIAHSTIPNVHPPGVEAYLVTWYKLVGFSIPVTRVAMLLLAGLGLLVTFLLALELTDGPRIVPAFLPAMFLLVSPLFYTQSMMAQLDMPAMLFTLVTLLLFIKKQYAAAAAASIGLVLMKETGLAVPIVFCALLLWRKDWRRAAYFLAPVATLIAWLVFLHHATGYWLGNPDFAHYNLEYALQPVHMTVSVLRRIYYVFFAEFRWIGTLALLLTVKRCKKFKDNAWHIALMTGLANFILVCVLGGAELERYLLPVLPIFYIGAALALSCFRPWAGFTGAAALTVGLLVNLFWNPPYPFPYEDNYAMVDFVRLQELAARYAERNLAHRTIATAWPYTAALQKPEYGFVEHKLRIVETNDFHVSSIRALSPKSFEVLITYTRTWAPQNGVIAIPAVRWFLTRFYEFEPEISPNECRRLGLNRVISWNRRGQETTIYARPEKAPISDLAQMQEIRAKSAQASSGEMVF